MARTITIRLNGKKPKKKKRPRKRFTSKTPVQIRAFSLPSGISERYFARGAVGVPVAQRFATGPRPLERFGGGRLPRSRAIGMLRRTRITAREIKKTGKEVVSFGRAAIRTGKAVVRTGVKAKRAVGEVVEKVKARRKPKGFPKMTTAQFARQLSKPTPKFIQEKRAKTKVQMPRSPPTPVKMKQTQNTRILKRTNNKFTNEFKRAVRNNP